MRVSIIIPTYNEESTIGECLKSLSEQSYREMEVIVVDDGSLDNTESVIKNFQFPHSKISGQAISNFQFLQQKHKGPGEARNLGAKHATGEILVFVDADMTFDRDFIKELVTPIIRGDLKGTFSREEYVSNPKDIWSECWGINQGWEKGRRHPKNYSDKQKVFRAILKSEFDKVGGFESGGHYTDDWSLSEKLGYEATVVSGAKFYHENPQSLDEIFEQATWSAKRKYKLGILGALIALVRASFPISLLIGTFKSVVYIRPHFIIFKIVYDLGTFIGILEYLILGKSAK